MSKKPLLRTLLIRFIPTVVIVGSLLFGFAGSLQYWNGWLLLIVLFVPATAASVYLYKRNPSLLEKRMKFREREKEQELYVKLSLLWFLVSIAVPGLDFRFGWSHVPVWLMSLSVTVMVAGYTFFMVSMAENSFASRVIELQADQHIIDTGLYSIVRHPMYAAAMMMFTAMPLVLGSYYGLIPTIPLPLLLGYRIHNEEKVLRDGLVGYAEYTRRVRFKLVPFIW